MGPEQHVERLCSQDVGHDGDDAPAQDVDLEPDEDREP